MATNRESYRGDVAVIKEGVSRTEVIAELGQLESYFKPKTGGFDDRYVLEKPIIRGSRWERLWYTLVRT